MTGDDGVEEHSAVSSALDHSKRFTLHPDLPTLKSLKPEHLFMLCARNSGEGPSEARSLAEMGVRGSIPEIKKKNIANCAIRVILELYL